MTKRAEKIIRERSNEFPHWTRTFRSFLEISYGYLRSTDTVEADILTTLILISCVRDEWDGPRFFPLAVKCGLEVIFRAEKIENQFMFGTNEHRFFLSSNLTYAENLRKMNDDFWKRRRKSL